MRGVPVTVPESAPLGRTVPSRSPRSLPEGFDRHLLGYALAAGAGLAAAVQPAEARVIVTPVDRILTPPYWGIDLNNDGYDEFVLRWTSYSHEAGILAMSIFGVPRRGNGVIGTGGAMSAARLGTGAMIGAVAGPWLNIGTALVASVNAAGSAQGAWGGDASGFLGLRFEFTSTHYGWARLSVHTGAGPSLEVKLMSYAWETEADQPIVAGGKSAVVPEPGTLGLLALGAVGLAVWRRRKRAN